MTLRRRTVLYAYVAEDADGTLSLVFVDGNGRAHQLITLTPVGVRTACERALRGIVYALWNARTLGYRRVVVHSDHPGAVAQINGDCRVDPVVDRTVPRGSRAHARVSLGADQGRRDSVATTRAHDPHSSSNSPYSGSVPNRDPEPVAAGSR